MTEIRLSETEALAQALGEIARSLDDNRPAYAQLAAEGSAVELYFAPFGAFMPALGAIPGRGAATVRHTFVARISWTPGAYWFGPCFHDVTTVEEKLNIPNPVDAVPVAIFLNLLELARGRRLFDSAPDRVDAAAKLMEIADQWIESIGRDRFEDRIPTTPLRGV